MKILQINTRYQGGGGASGIANSLHQYLNEDKEHSSFFLYGRGRSDDKNSMKITNQIDVYFSAFAARCFGKSINMYFNKEIERQICGAEIIHLHNLHGYYIHYKKLINLIVKYNKPVVWTVHDLWPITGRCAFPNECTKWITGCGSCKYKNLYPKTYIDISKKLWLKKKEIFNLLPIEKTCIVSPSRWLKEAIEKSYLKDYRVEIVPNGIKNNCVIDDEKERLRKEWNLPIDKKIILFVALDLKDPRKGIQYIFNIIEHFNDDMVFVSVGNKIDNINTNKLIQLGYIKNKEDLNKIYRACDIYMNPTLGETFSLTTAEALSNGLPVIGFDTGPIPELVDSNCGVLVEKGNEKELENAIVTILNDEQRIKEFSMNAFNKYKKYYTFEKFAEAYMIIYQDMINQYDGGRV